MKRLYISVPPDMTMMVEEALALIERPSPTRCATTAVCALHIDAIAARAARLAS